MYRTSRWLSLELARPGLAWPHRSGGPSLTGLARVLVSLAAVLGLVATGVVVASGPAHAAPTICTPNHRSLSFNTFGTPRVVTHAEYYSYAKGTSVSKKVSSAHVRTLSASATFSASGVVGVDFAIGKLEAKSGYTLAAAAKKTSSKSTKVQINIKGPWKGVVWRGKRQVKGSFTATRCNPDGTSKKTTKGNAKSWGVNGNGATKCSGKFSTSSWEHKAQKIAC